MLILSDLDLDLVDPDHGPAATKVSR
jgi:hypothetical protein